MLMTAVEGETARALSPPVAWPTLAMLALIAPLHVATVACGLSGAASPWLLTLPLGISAYLHYTPAHEAIHRNIVRSRRFDPANRLIGWWAGVLLGMSWPLLLRTHHAHHAHTNGERDPDAFVQGPLWRLFPLAALSVVTNLVPIPAWRMIYGRETPNLGYLDAWKVMRAREWRTHQIAHGLMCIAVWVAVALGHGAEIFALYVVPATVGRLLMGIFLSWLPHRPFAAGDRYHATALRRGRLLAIASIGHSLHLVHHLWPRVPFYRYGRLYRALSPMLHDRGVRVR
ncbi:fatty acid desaturase [Sphingomonas sp.]|uniref:fatty acid desaturase n=1 Tax=Sphingomonas sp. TaxID=28214 RepID=UPI002DB6EACC|nr:fatty acid desaturase [Sphingomonas sp.]HEU4969702.1 fatty acid desaturase [Sphingomonas sp.]